MDKIIDRMESIELDTLCQELSSEIVQLSEAKYRLKSVFVLLHIIVESRKALAAIDVTNFLNTLKQEINEVYEPSDIEKNQLIQTFMQDVKVVEAIDSKDQTISRLIEETKDRINEMESLLGRIVKQRDQLSLPELNKQ